MSAPASRTVTLTPSAFDEPRFPSRQDPNEVLDYSVDWNGLIATNAIATQTVTLDATAIAAGVTIGTGQLAPTSSSNVSTFWVTVSTPTNAAFIQGIEAVITLRVTTTGNPTRTLERSVRLLLRQSDQPTLSDLAPITLAQAKTHLRVDRDLTYDDAYIAALIEAARDSIERDTGLALRVGTFVDSYDAWADGGLVLRHRPVNSVTSVQYRDQSTGTLTTLAANQYRLETGFGLPRIVLAFGGEAPKTEATKGAVRVTYSAGYASNADIPAGIRHAALLLLAHWYDNREAVAMAQTHMVQAAYDALLGQHRIRIYQ
jgi:uncharacterized phiE125 gp8 family phage protein